MTTSTYNLALNQIITTAFEDLGVIGVGDSVSGDDYAKGVKTLNLMLKEWQMPMYGLHLWLYDEVTLFIEPGKPYYTLGGPNSDRVSDNIRLTYLSGDANVLDTIIGLNSTAEMEVGDNIGITLNNGTIQWTTITQIVDDIVNLEDELNDYALQNNRVYVYRENIGKIFEVDNLRVINKPSNTNPSVINNSSLIMFPISRQQFFSIPNRNIMSTPIQYFVDRRKNETRLWVYGTGTSDNAYLEFTAKRPLTAITDPNANVDFPEEWIGPITSNLEVRLAAAYEKEFKVGNPQSMATIANNAAVGMAALRDYDVEQTSLYFQPRLDDYTS